MSYFSKNKLIVFILIAMALGLVLGYIINTSITSEGFKYDRAKTEQIADPAVKKQVQTSLKIFEEIKNRSPLIFLFSAIFFFTLLK